MIKLDNFQVLIIKHPVEGVNLWSWKVYECYKFGIELESHYHFKSEQLAKADWEQFVKLNGFTFTWKYYSDKQSIQDIRTGSGAQI